MAIWGKKNTILINHILLSQCIIHMHRRTHTYNDTQTHMTDAINKHTHA